MCGSAVCRHPAVAQEELAERCRRGGEMAAGPDKVYQGPSFSVLFTQGVRITSLTGTCSDASGRPPDEAAALQWRPLTHGVEEGRD